MEDNLLPENIKYALESTILPENKNLFKVLLAINSPTNKMMIDEDIEKLTGLSNENVSESIRMLEKVDYIHVVIENIPQGSLHKVCSLTEHGKKILEVLKIK